MTLSLDDFDYTLPPSRIAQTPAPEREAARLFVL
ncbi:MAG: Queuosine biosynthesis protein, partial [Deltaproteobacteria bacterium]|nr:Queuosine biosynthesis protein [Deltaproteobacteria bacterium]